MDDPHAWDRLREAVSELEEYCRHAGNAEPVDLMARVVVAMANAMVAEWAPPWGVPR